ncbi:MAG: hypothetical protein GXY44_11430 [Phycisphaerales bacterium]|nr:hypothetical protein [Phycisphaerales bacterium]
MIVELTDEERDILRSLISREIADLGPEIRRTDHFDYRDELKIEKHMLRHLMDRLQAPEYA